MALKVFILAGEESADQLGAALVRALREVDPAVEVIGYGGRRLLEAGAKVRTSLIENASVGFVEVVPRLPFFARTYFEAKRWILAERPDVVIPIDNPGFNMRVGRAVKAAGIRVLYYVSPQVWAWRRSRVKGFHRNFDKMLVLFPFEAAFYREYGIEAEHVGHPIFDVLATNPPKEGLREELGLEPGQRLVALFPGSRDKSMAYLLPLFLDTAKEILARRPGTRFVLPAGKPRYVEWARRECAKRGLDVAILDGRAHDAMRAADFALTTSGTTTLECATFGLPMVIVYQTPLILWLLAKVFLDTKFIGLPNVVAGRRVVPEFLEWRRRPGFLADRCVELLDPGPVREKAVADLAEVRRLLGGEGPSRRAALAAVKLAEEGRLAAGKQPLLLEARKGDAS